MPILRGANMGLHADPSNAAHIARVQEAEAKWFRTWAWAEYQWMCSTPDSTSSRGSFDPSTEAAELHHVFDTTDLSAVYSFLGVPRVCNPRAGSGAGSAGDGSYHRFAIGTPGIFQYAIDALATAQAFFGGYENRGIFVLWNEPQIQSFSADMFYTPAGKPQGAEATAAVYGAMVAPAIRAIRDAMPTLPIGLELAAAAGDIGSRGTGLSSTYIGDTFALAVIDWLIANRPDALPDVAMFHPYVYTTGYQASLDTHGTRSSSPKTDKGWNGHLQMGLVADGLFARGFAKRDALLGTGTGTHRLSAKVIPTEFGCPSREPAHDTDPGRWFDDAFQSQHLAEEQDVIYFRQVVGQYHPLQIMYDLIDTASPTATSPGADLHDYFGLFRQSAAHKPALDTWRTWARKILVPDVGEPDPPPPDQPIVVPIEPPTSAVTSRISGAPSIYSVVGLGLLEAGQYTDRAYTRDEQHPRRNLARGVISLGGLGGNGFGAVNPGAMRGFGAQLWAAICHALKARPGMLDGYTFMGVQGFHTSGPGWGCDDSLDAIQDAIDAFQGNGQLGGAAPGKVAIVCESMGHVGAVNYALRHPDKVAGVLGFKPACSLEYHWNGGVDNLLSQPGGLGGTPTTIAIAYGLSQSPLAAVLDATVKAQRDPLTRAAELRGIPWGLSYGLNDTVVGRETVDAFIQARGGIDTFDLIRQYTEPDPTNTHGTNHLEPTELLSFLDGCSW